VGGNEQKKTEKQNGRRARLHSFNSRSDG
jgi:hypothetical protein